MIAQLRGILIEKHPNQAVVEAGGVGYDVTIPVSTFTHLPDAGAEVRLRIHTHVREDALSLYGFLTSDEKALFERLIGVSGIGPTLAVKVLSGVTAVDLVNALRRGEVERLVRIPGVGKKPPSAWCSNCAISSLPITGEEPVTPSRRSPRAGGAGRALRAPQSRLRPPAGRGRRAQSQGRRRHRRVRTLIPARFGVGTLSC